MKQPEHEAGRWLAQARDDLGFARYGEGARTVLEHSVHEFIVRLAPNHSELAALGDDAKQLDRFHIPTRYPNGLPGGTPFETFTRADLAQALAMAEKIVAAAGRPLP